MLDFTENGKLPDIGEFIEREGIECLDFKFCDLAGHWRHVTVPAADMSKRILEGGIGVDGSSVPKFAGVERGDVSITPDMRCGFIDEAFDRRCLSFICDVVGAQDLAPHPMDPRGVAKRAVQYLRSFDAANEIAFLPELEFYILDDVEYRTGDDEAYWRISSSEGSAEYDRHDFADYGGDKLGARWKIPDAQGYAVAPPLDAYVNLRDAIAERLAALGISVKSYHHEGGSYGQQELELQLNGLIETADSILLGKYITRLTAAEHGLCATFMPKPFPNQPGSGLHYHMLLGKDGASVSHDPAGYSGLSSTAISFIAGILHHGRSLMAIAAASTNSYRRLMPGFETPTSFFFAAANREAAVRIPLYTKEPAEKRWEFRASDATGNPYLALATLVMAGLDGIENGIDPKKEGLGPYDDAAPQLKRTPRNIKRMLPISLTEALHALDADHEYLLKGDVFSKDLLKTYINYKYDNEISAMLNQPHPYEFELYFNL